MLVSSSLGTLLLLDPLLELYLLSGPLMLSQIPPLRLNASPILVRIVESRGAPLNYAALKKFHGSAW